MIVLRITVIKKMAYNNIKGHGNDNSNDGDNAN